MPSLIGRCGGGSSSLGAWAGLRGSLGNPLVPPYPDPNFLTELDWSGASFRCSTPQAVTFAGVGVTLGSDGNSYVATVEYLLGINTVATGGIGAYNALGVRVLLGASSLMPSSGNFLNNSPGYRYIWGGTPRVAQIVEYGGVYVVEVNSGSGAGKTLNMYVSNDDPGNSSASVAYGALRIALTPTSSTHS